MTQPTQIHTTVGVMIAIVANTWTGRIVPPFIWGIIWCVLLALLPGGDSRPSLREYLRAVVGTLLPALFIGSLKALFLYILLH